MRPLIVALVAALTLIAPLAASAQDAPSYAGQQPAPSDGSGDAQIRGRIVNFDGGYNLQVRDERGYVDNVQLHDGTIINPTGITLAPGMVVSILGYNAGSVFGANEVDTPYTFYGSVPYYEDHPWNYYGGGISLGFFFGNTGWWHGDHFGGGGYRYGSGTGARVYNNVRVNSIYHGGTFQGREYQAPAARGGYYARGGAAHAGGGGGASHGGGGGGGARGGGGGGGSHGGGGGGHR